MVLRDGQRMRDNGQNHRIDVRGKRVLVVGLARSGRAVARAFRRRGALVIVTDSRPPAAFQAEIPELLSDKVGLELGLHREDTFLRQDLIVVSPGVPWDLPHLEAARQRKIPVVPEVEAAAWFLKGYWVGITGTNGKTTTTMLLGKMLEGSGFHTFVGGNIGVPLISAVDQVSRDSIIVAELSSFQLEAIQNFRANVAVLLNITPNHLDRHRSFEAYFRAKAEIFRNQTADDYAILNADDPTVMSLAPAIASRKVFFSLRQNLPDGILVSKGRILYRVGNLEHVLLETRDVKLRGNFNLENVLAAAAAAACVLGADFEALRRAVREFTGVEHRLEYVRKIHGVEFYNDSKATSVDATAKALSAFDSGVHLILGGKDKGAPYAPLRPLLEGRVRDVLLIGAAAERIAQELSGAAEIFRAGDLETAARQAFELSNPGDVVLLAPACASFDQFRDFEHRGRVFKEVVEHLAAETTGTRGSELGTRESGVETRNSKLETRKPPEASGFRISSFDSRDPNPESRTPNPDSRLVYEAAAEEVAPLEESEVGGSESGVEVASEDLPSPERVEDEPLLFEVVTPASSSTSRAEEVALKAAAPPNPGPNGPRVRRSKARKGEPESPPENTTGQERLFKSSDG